MANIEEKVEALLGKTIQNLGYELYDVIYEKEAKDYYLRIFIDSPKGIGLNDCETVNNAISNMLDEANYIKEQYFLEVSSTGVERTLRKDKHFKQNIGKEVTINLFKPIAIKSQDNKNGNTKNKKQFSYKQIEGILKSFDDEKIVVAINDVELPILRKDISNIKLKYHWQ